MEPLWPRSLPDLPAVSRVPSAQGRRTVNRLDKLGRWLLIYEGFVLASRAIHPGLSVPPALSQLVWRLPRPLRMAATLLIGVWLGTHWVPGDRSVTVTFTEPTSG